VDNRGWGERDKGVGESGGKHLLADRIGGAVEGSPKENQTTGDYFQSDRNKLLHYKQFICIDATG
jgi:hypothetical protein